MLSDSAVEDRLNIISEKKLEYAPPGFDLITSLKEVMTEYELAGLSPKVIQIYISIYLLSVAVELIGYM